MDESPSAALASRDTGPLRIALLLETTAVSPYVYDLVQWLHSQPNIETTLLVLAEAEAAPRLRPVAPGAALRRRSTRSRLAGNRASAASAWTLRLIQRLERLLIWQTVHHRTHFERFDAASLVGQRIALGTARCTPDGDRRLATADRERLDGLGLDLIVSCMPDNPSEDILRSARLGVVSLCPLDHTTDRPAGFWEVYHRRDTTSFSIQRLDRQSDRAEVLMRGNFPTRSYYSLNQACLYRKAFHYLKSIIGAVASSRTLPRPIPRLPYSGHAAREPRLHETILYAGRLGATLLRKGTRRLCGVHHRWSVRYVDVGWRDADYGKARGLPNEPFHYLADPFAIERNGSTYCFVEDYDYATRRGSIAAYELTATGGRRLGTALEEPFHLSFPFLLEYQGALYMCPESSGNRDIRIYRCLDFPLRWRLEQVLMQEVSAADTMLFERDGRWWMLTNIDPVEIGDHCSELFIFSASSPLERHWRPHPLNPVIVDAARARNAGLASEGGEHFRMSQGQGFDIYGKQVLINQIVELSETSYREECLSVIRPLFAPRLLGTHHLHGTATTTVFDVMASSRISRPG
jgi:hypothetical protein